LRQAIDPGTRKTAFSVDRVGFFQQMSFNEFYQLDRVGSKAGRGNLVLLGQGEDGRGVVRSCGGFSIFNSVGPVSVCW
jgi:hypothetical protein